MDFRHDEDQPVAMRGGNKSKRDPCVTRGGLDENALPGLDLPRLLQRPDHRNANAILDAGNRVEEFKLRKQIGLNAIYPRQLVEPHDRGVSDCLGDGSINAAPAWSVIPFVVCCFKAHGGLPFLFVPIIGYSIEPALW